MTKKDTYPRTGIMMKIFRSLLLLSVLLFLTIPVFALAEDDVKESDAEQIDEVKSDCTPTPNVDPSFIPFGVIRKTNNLLRKAGSPYIAKGKYAEISGKVLDQDCVPISNAIVQIWQTDSEGKYQSQPDEDYDWESKDAPFDRNFGYTGTVTTNNLGEFTFITIFPGTMDEASAPHINIFVKQNDFEDLSSRIYFAYHPRNKADAALKNLSEEEAKFVTAKGSKIDPSGQYEGRDYDINIVLHGINKYRRF